MRQVSNNNNTHTAVLQYNVAVPPPQQYTQSMMVLPPMTPGPVMSLSIDFPPIGYSQPYPYKSPPPQISEKHGVKIFVLYEI